MALHTPEVLGACSGWGFELAKGLKVIKLSSELVLDVALEPKADASALSLCSLAARRN